MKTQIATLMVVLGIFLSVNAFANESDRASSVVSKSVASYLMENLDYPDFALDKNFECSIWVEITIRENGSFWVTAGNCIDDRMKKEVVSSIEKLNKHQDLYAPFAGKKVYLKITFNLNN